MAADESLPREGDLIAGKYRIEQLLGRGGVGAVFAARDESLHRDVAIKVLRRGSIGDRAATRLVNEARAAARIESPHIVRVLDAGTLESGSPYLVMERLEGLDLEQLLRAEGRLAPADAVRYVGEAIDALAQAHALGIVHRDLKPANLFLHRPRGAASGTIKVLDFGISKAGDALGAPLESLTTDDSLLGTPMYMAPEQFKSPKGVDARADVWALGVILYELVTGARPFAAQTLGELVVAVLQAAAPRVSDRAPDAPASLDPIVARCLATVPDFRYPDVAALAEDLSAIDPTLAPLAARARATLGAPPSARTQPAVAEPGGLGATADSTLDEPIAAEGDRPARGASPPSRRVAWVAAAVITLGAGGATWALRRPAKVANEAPPAAPHRECARAADCPGDGAAICRADDGACVPLASEDCTAVAEPEALRDDATLWLGAMLPLRGDQAKEIGTPWSRGFELGRRDFTSIARGLPALSAEGKPRPLGVIACDDSADPARAARHLRGARVPAVIGFKSSNEALDLATRLFLPARVLTLSVLNTSPLVTTIPHPRGVPRLVWRTALSSALTSDVVAAVVKDVLEPAVQKRKAARADATPMRLALVRPGTTAGLGFFDALFAKLRFNGRSAIDNGDAFAQLVFGDPTLAEGATDYARVVDGVLRQKPDVIVYVGQDEITKTVLEPIERRWDPKTPRPTFVAANSFAGDDFFAFVRAEASRRGRFLGIAAPSSSVPNAKFTMRYNETFPEPTTLEAAPASSYDAFYVLAYAAYAAGEGPITGEKLARAMARLVPPGRAIEVGPSRIHEAFEALRAGENVDLVGAGSTLDFDLATGDTNTDFVVLCVRPPGPPGSPATGESGLAYDARTKSLRGAARCP